MKNLIKKIILCFLLFFLWLNSAFWAIWFNNWNSCEVTWLTSEENWLFISKNNTRYDTDYSNYCWKINIWSISIYKNNDDSFIITNKWIYYGNNFKSYIHTERFIDLISNNIFYIIYILILFLIFVALYSYIETILKYKLLKYILYIIYNLILGFIIISSLNWVNAWCIVHTSITLKTFIFISLLFLYYYIRFYSLQDEHIKLFNDIETPSFKILWLTLFIWSLIHITDYKILIVIIWWIFVIWFLIIYIKDIINILKENTLTYSIKIYFLLLFLLILSTIFPYISRHC